MQTVNDRAFAHAKSLVEYLLDEVADDPGSVLSDDGWQWGDIENLCDQFGIDLWSYLDEHRSEYEVKRLREILRP